MQKKKDKRLIVLSGPTAVGKTATSIKLAQHIDTVILSADSRQFYSGMKIGTAAPTEEELKAVNHYFIGHLKIGDYYNVSRFEQDALAVLEQEFQKHDQVILTGGSGLYIDALCRGVDEFPDPDPYLREDLKKQYQEQGIEWLQDEVQKADPEYFGQVDKKNPNRLLRALEVCLATGKPYSEQRIGNKRERSFDIIYIALNRPREELFERIHLRTDQMLQNGLIEEVKSLAHLRHENALNTVGYKEIFTYLDGDYSLELATEKIKTNTRRYAKRQLTWFRKNTAYHWLHPDQEHELFELTKF